MIREKYAYRLQWRVLGCTKAHCPAILFDLQASTFSWGASNMLRKNLVNPPSTSFIGEKPGTIILGSHGAAEKTERVHKGFVRCHFETKESMEGDKFIRSMFRTYLYLCRQQYKSSIQNWGAWNSVSTGTPTGQNYEQRNGRKYAAAVALADYAKCVGLDNNLRTPFVLLSCSCHAACQALALYAANPCSVAHADGAALTVVAACALLAVVARYVALLSACAYALLLLRSVRFHCRILSNEMLSFVCCCAFY